MPSNLATRSSSPSDGDGLDAAMLRPLMTVCVAAILFFSAATAGAQVRPYRSLFAGAAAEEPARDLLDFAFSLGEAYDSRVLDPDGAANPTGLQLGGFFTSLSGDLRYAKRREHAEVVVNLSTNFRYFHEQQAFEAIGHALGAGVSLDLGPRTTLSINEAFGYRPSYLHGLFAKTQAPVLGATMPAASDYAINDQESYTSVTTLNLQRKIGRRMSLDFVSGYRRTVFNTRTGHRQDLTAYDVGGWLRYPLGRAAALKLGYTYRRAEYVTDISPTEHDILLGVEYDRPLSRSRKTWLSFRAGSSIVEGPLPAASLGNDPVRQLRATADLQLNHQMGRTWSARAAYHRGANYIEELSVPVFTDGATVSLDGFLNRRTDVEFTAAYTEGDYFERERSAFQVWTGAARIRFGLTRNWATFAEYVYYDYGFGAGAPLLAGVPSQVGRHGARIGLTLWAAAFRK